MKSIQKLNFNRYRSKCFKVELSRSTHWAGPGETELNVAGAGTFRFLAPPLSTSEFDRLFALHDGSGESLIHGQDEEMTFTVLHELQ